MRAGPVRTRELVLIFWGISVLSSPFVRKPNPAVPSSQPQAALASNSRKSLPPCAQSTA
jgi:hypothetical protein